MYHILKSFQAAKRELERQRQLEWERNRRQELLNQRNKEQEDIVVLKAKKKTLEFELEALVSKNICKKSANNLKEKTGFVLRNLGAQSWGSAWDHGSGCMLQTYYKACLCILLLGYSQS